MKVDTFTLANKSANLQVKIWRDLFKWIIHDEVKVQQSSMLLSVAAPVAATDGTSKMERCSVRFGWSAILATDCRHNLAFSKSTGGRVLS